MHALPIEFETVLLSSERDLEWIVDEILVDFPGVALIQRHSQKKATIHLDPNRLDDFVNELDTSLGTQLPDGATDEIRRGFEVAQ